MDIKKKTHIIYIITKLELGGAQKTCLSLFKNLKIENNYSTSLITSSDGILLDTLKKNIYTKDMNLYLIKSLKREISIFNIFNEIIAFFEILNIILKIKYDNLDSNIIVHTNCTKAGLIGRWAAFFAGIKHIVHTYHGHAFNPNQNMFKNFIVKFFEYITSFVTTNYICVSKKDVDSSSKFLYSFNKRCRLIRPSVNYNIFKNFQISLPVNNLFIFGTISCFKPVKNLSNLIEAFYITYQKNKNIRLEIIGDGLERDKLLNIIKKYQLEQVITLYSWVLSSKNVAEIISKWHTFLLTSIWEGLPCSIVEARILKMPVIAYNVGGISEVIFNDKNGFLHNFNDVKSFSDSMLSISSNILLFKRLSSFNDNIEDFKDNMIIYNHILYYNDMVSCYDKKNYRSQNS